MYGNRFSSYSVRKATRGTEIAITNKADFDWIELLDTHIYE